MSSLNSIKRGPNHGGSCLPEYKAWKSMWSRCTDPKNQGYVKYQHRKPPDCWKSFPVFYAELGPKPSPKHTLERIKNELPYGPGNCCWATHLEQHQNTSSNVNLTLNNKVQCLTAWARELGMSPDTLNKRLNLGWSVERALTQPLRKKVN